MALLAGGGIGYYIGYDQALVNAFGSSAGMKEQGMGMTNPASTNCIKLGGTLEIKDETNGQVGYCHLKSGKTCEEWALFRGTCK